MLDALHSGRPLAPAAPVMLNLDAPYEEPFWCVLLEVDAARLRAAVAAAGPGLPAVCRYLLGLAQE